MLQPLQLSVLNLNIVMNRTPFLAAVDINKLCHSFRFSSAQHSLAEIARSLSRLGWDAAIHRRQSIIHNRG